VIVEGYGAHKGFAFIFRCKTPGSRFRILFRGMESVVAAVCDERPVFFIIGDLFLDFFFFFVRNQIQVQLISEGSRLSYNTARGEINDPSGLFVRHL
jgi:hypothetical protein